MSADRSEAERDSSPLRPWWLVGPWMIMLVSLARMTTAVYEEVPFRSLDGMAFAVGVVCMLSFAGYMTAIAWRPASRV